MWSRSLRIMWLTRWNPFMFLRKYYNSDSYKIAPFISLVSFAHMAVDAACAFLLLSLLGFYDNPLVALLLYNGVAFALQAPLGWVIDKWFHQLAAI